MLRGRPSLILPLLFVSCSAAPAQVPLGANIDGVTDYSRTYAFTDAMKSSRGFGSADAPYDGKATLDPDGWPTGDFGVFILTQGVHAGGTYHLSFTGAATITAFASPAAVKNQSYDLKAGRTTADIVVDDGAEQLALSFRDTQTGVQNLRLIRPGYPADSPPTFTKVFLDHLRRFAVLRFMDWSRTNDNPVVHWADRTRTTDPQFTNTRGVPWETVIELANTLHKDPWINVPAMADDDYVAHLAALFKAALEPGRAVWVEYSNEVWNPQFGQAAWNREAAIAEAAAGGSPLNADGDGDPNHLAWRRVAKRAKEIGDLFRAAFGPADAGRVRLVLAGQVAQAATFGEGLRFVERAYGPPGKVFAALAGAPYFGLGAADQRTDLSPDDVLAALSAGVDGLRSSPDLSRMIAYAAFYGLMPVFYEGGPDTFGPNNVAAKRAASADPRMQALCARYLSEMYARGGGLFEWFTAGATNWTTPFGTWGLAEDLTQAPGPKLRALDQVLASPVPALSAGFAVPGELDARAYVGAPSPSADPSLRYLAQGSSFDYLVRAPSPQKIALSISAGAPAAGATLLVYLHDALALTVAIPRSGSLDAFADSAPGELQLSPGLNTIRLVVPADRPYQLNSLKLGAVKNSLPRFGGLQFFWQQSIPPNGTFANWLSVSDAETAAAELKLTVSSDNQSLVPDARIVLTRAAADPGRFDFVVAPAKDAQGVANITFTVTDAGGLSRSVFFNLTVR